MKASSDRFPKVSLFLALWCCVWIACCVLYLAAIGEQWRLPAATAVARIFSNVGLENSAVPIRIGNKYWIARQVIDGLGQFPSTWGKATILLWNLPLVSIMMVGICVYLVSYKYSSKRTQLVRGVKVVGQSMASKTKKPEIDVLKIGDVPIPFNSESLHFLVAGSTGTGKSQIINSFLKTLRDRGDKVLIVDSGGEAMARMFRDGDALLNPLDARSAKWSPFSEMTAAHDADRLANSMIPVAESGPEREWQIYSQAVVAALLQRLFEAGGSDARNERLTYLLTVAKADEIEPIVKGLPAQTLFDTGAAKMLSSVRGIIGSYLPAYRFLDPDTGIDGFSIRKWVQDNDSKWLWIPYKDDQLTSIKSLISCYVGEAVNASLSVRPSNTRRLWIFCDELASLGRIAALIEGLTKGRKYGLSVVAGLQSVSQLRAVFGQHESQTLLSCLSTLVCLRAADAETAQYFSDGFGKREIRRQDQTDQSEGGKSTSMKHVVEDAIMASQISGLRPLTGYLRTADRPDVVHEIVIPICDLGAERVVPYKSR